MRLENVTHIGRTPFGEFRTREFGDVGSINHNRPRIRTIDTGNQVQQRRLTGSAGSHQRDKFALRNR